MKVWRTGLVVALLMLVLGLVIPVTAQEPVTVTWWTDTNPNIDDINANFVQPFNDSHPNIHLEVVAQETLDDQLRTAIQAGQAPDILQTAGNSFIAEFVPAGVVAPMDDYAAAHGWQDVPVYEGSDLRPGCTLPGPLLIEERTTTAFVGPRDTLEIDARDDFLVHIDGNA